MSDEMFSVESATLILSDANELASKDKISSSTSSA
jgi:hypothetical protein